MDASADLVSIRTLATSQGSSALILRGSRGSERGAVVAPAVGLGVAFVVDQDEVVDGCGQFVARGELATAQQPSGQGREEQLDLVEP
jgi:hypothetical protein